MKESMGVDRAEIVDVLVRYATAIDTKDWRLFRTCFADEVTANYSDIGSWNGVEDLTAFMVSAHGGMGRTQHSLSNFVIEIAGDQCHSLTYVHAVTVLARHLDDWIDTIGTYEDQLERRADGWHITSRIFRVTRTMLSPSLSMDSRTGTSGTSS
ncbi:MAG: nuclear transport factor 2 family protein [Acidimicrobiales bacterium]|jgi:3-phenylpropionate/cinnamic acid dioxygenase small subunit